MSFNPIFKGIFVFLFIVSPKKVVGYRGGNRYVEGESLTFGELMLDDYLPSCTIGYLMLDNSFGFPYYRLFNI